MAGAGVVSNGESLSVDFKFTCLEKEVFSDRLKSGD